MNQNAQEMSNLISEALLILEADGLKFKQKLPAGFRVSDVLGQQKLIELEEVASGKKTKLPIERVFFKDLTIGEEYVVPKPGDLSYRVMLEKIEGASGGKRNFAIAVFSKIEGSEFRRFVN